MLCDGSNVSRTTYADLFAAIGTTYGTGDGSSTFGLPSLDGRSLLFQASGGNAGTGNVGGSAGNASENVDPTNHVTLTNNQTATGAIVVNGNVANHTLTESELPSLTGDALFLNRGGGAQNHNIIPNTNGSFPLQQEVLAIILVGKGEGANQSTKLRISFGGGGSHDHNHNIQVNSQTVNLSDAANTVVLGHNDFSVLSPSTRLRAVIKT